MQKLKSLWLNAHVRHWTGLLILMAISVFGVNTFHQAGGSLSSLLDIPQHAAFDGTVLPIQRVPDWTHLTTAEYSMSYKDLPLDKFLATTPAYDDADFTFPSADLVWGNTAHDEIRNTKITYPVAYTGDYRLGDTGERSGSHPAVDIKVMDGTPIHNVANGVVKQSGYSSSWGNYVVVKHTNVPTPGSSQLTDMYCSYSHMNGTPFVKENEVLIKGQVIGEVGETGTATTHHLHFQCDSALAPWHPYWPFTGTEASNAGYGFFDAVNESLGLANVYAYTYNPMDWVQENLNGNVVYVPVQPAPIVLEPEPDPEPEPVVEEVVEPVVEPEPVVVEEVVPDAISFFGVSLDGPEYIITGDQKEITLELLDENGEILDDNPFFGEMTVSLSNEEIGNLNRTSFGSDDFKNGKTDLVLYADHEGELDVLVSLGAQTFNAGTIRLINEIAAFGYFGIEHDGAFVPNVAEDIQVLALDLEGEPTPSFRGDGPVQLSLVSGSGTFSKSVLKRADFNTGIAHVDFTSTGTDKVILMVTYGTRDETSDSLYAQLFDDLSENDNSYEAISYLYKEGAISGYPNGTFQPDRSVNRLESLKLAFASLDVNLTGNEAKFPDTERGQWYSDYLGSAVDLGVVAGYPDGTFKPLQTVNKVELLKIILTLADVDVDPVVIGNPYEDVGNLAWHAPYVQYAKENKLFDVTGDNFGPGEAMTRREVAEVIYRLVQVLDK